MREITNCERCHQFVSVIVLSDDDLIYQGFWNFRNLAVFRAIFSPPGKHRDAASGLMFYRRFSFFLFLNVASCHSTTGARIAPRLNALTPLMKKTTTAKNSVNFGQGTLPRQPMLWHETATSWHSAFIVCTGILQRLERSQNLYSYQDPRWTVYIV